VNPLPGPLAEPLHILPPWLLLAAVLALLLALLLLPFLWWWRRRRRRQQQPVPRASFAASVPEESWDWFAPRVDEIVGNHCRERSYREGCHDLSAAVKQRLEELSRLEIEEMTVTEISACLDEDGIDTFLRRLMSHQFDKQPPGKNDLKRLGKESKQLLGKWRLLQRRKTW
jgi:hypothetical protein